MDGSQPVVPCGWRAVPLIKYPIKVPKNVLSCKMLETQSLNCNTLLGVHEVDILDKGISISRQGVGANVTFMGQILRQEPAKLFCKICRCRHKPCRVLGKQKHLLESTSVPYLDTSRRLGEHTAPLPTANGAPDRQIVWADQYISQHHYDPSEPSCEQHRYVLGRVLGDHNDSL